ncbi:MAG: N-6 DNA methylase [Candidatus Lokiarchaeota archaeon]|nr:N-6 DNA methylase [Candidatus Lokiarchaeota archaeon]
MSNHKNLSQFFGLKSSTYNRTIKEIRNFLIKEQNQEIYKVTREKWRSYFRDLYSNDHLNLDLLLKHSYLVFLCKIIAKKILNIEFNSINPFEHNLFNWLDELNNLKDDLIAKISHFAFDTKNNVLIDFYQEIISSKIRHSMGEFYTPEELAKVMIDNSYEFGDKVLDPACGSGIFLIEIIKTIISSPKLSKKNKSEFINEIYGIDINPVVILITRINLLLLTRNFEGIEIADNIHLANSLNLDENISNNIGRVDLIIGNPPWLVYRDLESKEYQVLIKEIAKRNDIKPQAKDISNLEITTIFFYEISREFLKFGGKIFFIMTSNVLNGSQSQKFRNFKGFTNIQVWKFQRKLFNIKNIALKAMYQKNSQDPYPIKMLLYNEEFKVIEQSKLVPSYIEGGNIKKLIEANKKLELLPIIKSYYYKNVHKGADLFPRALIFVKIKKKKDYLIVNRDMEATARSKKPWNKTFFKDIEIEQEYVFKTIKANLLIPFSITGVYKVALPINREYQKIPIEDLKPKMKTFYKKINQIYIGNKKSTTKFVNLWQNINYRNKLIKQDPNLFKVVYNEAGSKLKSAVVDKNILLDYTLLYHQTPNIDECYYLCAILNSSFLNENLKIIKSSRHFVKRPFKFNIPEYNPSIDHHCKLKELARKCEDIIKKNKKIKNFTPKIKSELLEINKIVKSIF